MVENFRHLNFPGHSASYLKLGEGAVAAEMPGIMGGHTLSRRPKKGSERISNVIRRVKTGLGKDGNDEETRSHLTCLPFWDKLSEILQETDRAQPGCSLQRALGRVQQGAEKQAGLESNSARPGCSESLGGFPCLHVLNAVESLGIGEAGWNCAGATDLLEKAEKLECYAARLPRHTLTRL
jgi:hypothetical protein